MRNLQAEQPDLQRLTQAAADEALLHATFVFSH